MIGNPVDAVAGTLGFYIGGAPNAVDRVVEELDAVTFLAAAAGTPSDVMLLVAALHREALQRFGPIGGELLAAKLLEARAGRTLRT